MTRNRIFLTSTTTAGPTPPYQELVLDGDYERHPVVKIATLMTPRRATKCGNPVWSDPYFAIKHILFSPSGSHPAGQQQMREQICDEDGTPVLPVDINSILPPNLVKVWHLYQQWCVSKTKCPISSSQRTAQAQPSQNQDWSYRQVIYIYREEFQLRCTSTRRGRPDLYLRRRFTS